MAMRAREALIEYFLVHARMLGQPGGAPAAAELLARHARALQLLAELVRGLADDDERLLTLGALAVRGGKFLPGPATEHALSQFTGASMEECDVFFSELSRVARDDALTRARQHGFLPPQRPV